MESEGERGIGRSRPGVGSQGRDGVGAAAECNTRRRSTIESVQSQMSTDTESRIATEPDPAAPAEEPEHAPVEELDEETRARRDAALRQVRKLGDPVLRASAVAVERFDERLRAEVQRMGELMQDALGVGLAATQVGVLHRVLVYKAYEDDPVTALVNPVLEWESEERETKEEGCLSLPGVHVEVERAARVRVRAQDTHGKELVVEEEGLPARVIQHEMDHLEGMLILDRISREARRDAMRALREAREANAPDRPTRARSARRLPLSRALGDLRTVFLGTSDFAAAVLERLAASEHRPALVLTRPDRPRGRGRKVGAAAGGAGGAGAWHRGGAAGERQRPAVRSADRGCRGREAECSWCAPSGR